MMKQFENMFVKLVGAVLALSFLLTFIETIANVVRQFIFNNSTTLSLVTVIAVVIFLQAKYSLVSRVFKAVFKNIKTKKDGDIKNNKIDEKDARIYELEQTVYEMQRKQELDDKISKLYQEMMTVKAENEALKKVYGTVSKDEKSSGKILK